MAGREKSLKDRVRDAEEDEKNSYKVPTVPLVYNSDLLLDENRKPSYWEDGVSQSRGMKSSLTEQDSLTQTDMRETSEGRRQSTDNIDSETNEISTGGRRAVGESSFERGEDSEGSRQGRSVTRRGPTENETTKTLEGELNSLQSMIKAYKASNKEDKERRRKDAEGWLDGREANIDKRELAERLGHAITQLGAGLYGMKSGTDMSALVFDKKDFNKDRDRLLDRFKTQLAAIQEESDADRQERQFGVSTLSALASQLQSRLGNEKQLAADSVTSTENAETSSNSSRGSGRETSKSDESSMGFTQRKGKESRRGEETSSQTSNRQGSEKRQATERGLMKSDETTKTSREGDKTLSPSAAGMSFDEWLRRETAKSEMKNAAIATAEEQRQRRENLKTLDKLLLQFQNKNVREPQALLDQIQSVAVDLGVEPTAMQQAVAEEKHWLRRDKGDAAAAAGRISGMAREAAGRPAAKAREEVKVINGVEYRKVNGGWERI